MEIKRWKRVERRGLRIRWRRGRSCCLWRLALCRSEITAKVRRLSSLHNGLFWILNGNCLQLLGICPSYRIVSMWAGARSLFKVCGRWYICPFLNIKRRSQALGPCARPQNALEARSIIMVGHLVNGWV